MSPFYRWLLKHRVYCELCSHPNPATKVVKIRRHPAWPETRDAVVCDAHWSANSPIESGLREQGKLQQLANRGELQKGLNT